MFAAGGVAGQLSWIVSYPQDVLKSRMQGDTEGKYRSVTHCLKASLAAEGPGFLMRGIGSTLIRAFPVNAVTLGVANSIMAAHEKQRTDVSAYDTICRLDQRLHFEFPAALEMRLNANYGRRSLSPNLSTMYTDMPSIVKVRRFHFAIEQERQRLYAETAQLAMPAVTGNQLHSVNAAAKAESDIVVGTIRKPVPLSAIVRVMEKMVIPVLDRVICPKTAAKEIASHGNVILDGDSILVMEEEEQGRRRPVVEPSVLRMRAGLKVHSTRKNVITTSDLMNVEEPRFQKESARIYGFYYLI